METTTLIAGGAIGAAGFIAASEAWRAWTYDEPGAVLRGVFALIVGAVTAVAALAVVGSTPEIRVLATSLRTVGTLAGFPLLAVVLGRIVDTPPPRWLLTVCIATAVVAAVMASTTDLLVTGEVSADGIPLLGPAFLWLSISGGVAITWWTLRVIALSTTWTGRFALSALVGLPELTAMVILGDPTDRSRLWVGLLAPVLGAAELGRWRAMNVVYKRSIEADAHRERLAAQITETNTALEATLATRGTLLDAATRELLAPASDLLVQAGDLARSDASDAGARATMLTSLVTHGTALQEIVDAALTRASRPPTATPRTEPLRLRPVLDATASLFDDLAGTLTVSCDAEVTVAADALELSRTLATVVDRLARPDSRPAVIAARAANGRVEVRFGGGSGATAEDVEAVARERALARIDRTTLTFEDGPDGPVAMLALPSAS